MLGEICKTNMRSCSRRKGRKTCYLTRSNALKVSQSIRAYDVKDRCQWERNVRRMIGAPQVREQFKLSIYHVGIFFPVTVLVFFRIHCAHAAASQSTLPRIGTAVVDDGFMTSTQESLMHAMKRVDKGGRGHSSETSLWEKQKNSPNFKSKKSYTHVILGTLDFGIAPVSGTKDLIFKIGQFSLFSRMRSRFACRISRPPQKGGRVLSDWGSG